MTDPLHPAERHSRVSKDARALGHQMLDECARIAAIEQAITDGLQEMLPHRRRLWAASQIAIRTTDPARSPALMSAIADIIAECDHLRFLALRVAAEGARLSEQAPAIRPASPPLGSIRAQLAERFPTDRRP